MKRATKLKKAAKKTFKEKEKNMSNQTLTHFDETPETKATEEGFTEMKDISPTWAMDLLSTVPDYQRKLDALQVKRLLTAINRGDWRLNGSTIKINDRGELIDGQHRLTAIVQSGKTVRSLVTTGLRADYMTFATLGDVKARQAADFIRTKDPFRVAAVLRLLWYLDNNILFAKRLDPVPVPEIVKYASKHALSIEKLMNPLRDASKITRTGAWIPFLMYYYATRRPPEETAKVAEFFARVGDGANLAADSPALLLRNRATEKNANLGLAKLSRRVMEALVLKALNAHLDGKTGVRLTWSPERESFPSLRGYEPEPKADVKKKTKAKTVKEANE